MKKQIWLAAVLAIFFLGTAHAARKTSAELGQELFNDPKLNGSTDESSCNSCHAGGKGLENVAGKKKLSKLVNNCLVGKMAGEKLDGRTANMRSLKMYIQSLHE